MVDDLLILLAAALALTVSMTWLNLKAIDSIPVRVLTYILVWIGALTSATTLLTMALRVYNG